jgi:two-component system response regulator YesN
MYKVFLAEDEIVVREGIRNNISWEKIPFTLAGEAPDGEIALSRIKDVKPDILITDIRMPFMDGLALSAAVKKSFPWIKIIILSGHDEFQYAREAISIGIEEYLLKPVSAQDMLKTLDKVAKRIDSEKNEYLNIENLKSRVQSYSEALKILNDELSREVSQAADSITAASDAGNGAFDPTCLKNFNADIFYTKLRYAAKNEIDSIVWDLVEMIDGGWGSPAVYFLLGEIIVASSKIAETFGGNIKNVIPFSLTNDNIHEITGSRDAFAEKVKSLLVALIEYRDSRAQGRYQSVIVKAREYIDHNFNSPDISLYSTAAHIGISPNHFSTVFAQETGENFIEYLTRARIDRAKLLLKSSSMKSADIARETGFSDPHYFSYIFKKHSGLSPREFRLRER